MKTFTLLLLCFLTISSTFSTVLAQQSETADSLQTEYELAESDTAKIRLLAEMAEEIKEDDFNQALEYTSQAKNLIEGTGDNNWLGQILTLELYVTSRIGEYDKIIEKSNNAIKSLEKINDPDFLPHIYLIRGNAFLEKGEDNHAIENYTTSIELAKDLNNPRLEINAINNISLILSRKEELEKADTYLRRGLEVALQYELKYEANMIRVNLALNARERQNYGESIELLEQALIFYEEIENRYAESLILNNLAIAYLQIKEYSKAREFTLKSLELKQDIGEKRTLPLLYHNLGKIEMEQANWSEAIEYTQTALALSHEVSRPVFRKDIYETLYTIYDRTNNAALALENYIHFTELKDSLQQAEKEDEINNAITNFEEESLAAMETRHEAAILEMDSKNRQMLILFLVIVAGGLIGFIFIYRNRNQSLQQKQKKLNVAEDEKSNLRIEVEELQKELRSRDEEIQKIQAAQVERSKKITRELTQQLVQNQGHRENYWNEFLLQFSTIYPEFFSDLKQEYPELTQNELRICALVKLNLSLLEMSTALNITSESVRKARYRIYKKMNLESDQELVVMLLNYS